MGVDNYKYFFFSLKLSLVSLGLESTNVLECLVYEVWKEKLVVIYLL